jgi:hypothetical protein
VRRFRPDLRYEGSAAPIQNQGEEAPVVHGGHADCRGLVDRVPACAAPSLGRANYGFRSEPFSILDHYPAAASRSNPGAHAAVPRRSPKRLRILCRAGVDSPIRPRLTPPSRSLPPRALRTQLLPEFPEPDQHAPQLLQSLTAAARTAPSPPPRPPAGRSSQTPGNAAA